MTRILKPPPEGFFGPWQPTDIERLEASAKIAEDLHGKPPEFVAGYLYAVEHAKDFVFWYEIDGWPRCTLDDIRDAIGELAARKQIAGS